MLTRPWVSSSTAFAMCRRLEVRRPHIHRCEHFLDGLEVVAERRDRPAERLREAPDQGVADGAGLDHLLEVPEPTLVVDGRDGVDHGAVGVQPLGGDDLLEELPGEVDALVVLGEPRTEHIPDPVGVLLGGLFAEHHPLFPGEGVLVGGQTGQRPDRLDRPVPDVLEYRPCTAEFDADRSGSRLGRGVPVVALCRFRLSVVRISGRVFVVCHTRVEREPRKKSLGVSTAWRRRITSSTTAARCRPGSGGGRRRRKSRCRRPPRRSRRGSRGAPPRRRRSATRRSGSTGARPSSA